LLENAIARYVTTGTPPGPLGSRHPSITPFAAFQTLDQPIIVAAGNNGLFAKLCEAIGAPSLATDSRFTTNDLRNTNHAALAQELERALGTNTAAHWLAKIEAAGVPCGPINNVAQVLADPHIQSRNMVVTLQDADIGELKLAGNPMKLSAAPDPSTRAAAQALDESGPRIRSRGFAAIK
jgi:CoA:oxalate CoA-transferase